MTSQSMKLMANGQHLCLLYYPQNYDLFLTCIKVRHGIMQILCKIWQSVQCRVCRVLGWGHICHMWTISNGNSRLQMGEFFYMFRFLLLEISEGRRQNSTWLNWINFKFKLETTSKCDQLAQGYCWCRGQVTQLHSMRLKFVSYPNIIYFLSSRRGSLKWDVQKKVLKPCGGGGGGCQRPDAFQEKIFLIAENAK